MTYLIEKKFYDLKDHIRKRKMKYHLELIQIVFILV